RQDVGWLCLDDCNQRKQIVREPLWTRRFPNRLDGSPYASWQWLDVVERPQDFFEPVRSHDCVIIRKSDKFCRTVLPARIPRLTQSKHRFVQVSQVRNPPKFLQDNSP